MLPGRHVWRAGIRPGVNLQRTVISAGGESFAVWRELERGYPIRLVVECFYLSEVGGVEYFDCPVAGRRDERLAVRRPRQFENRVFVRDQGIHQCRALLAQLPDANRFIETPGSYL